MRQKRVITLALWFAAGSTTALLGQNWDPAERGVLQISGSAGWSSQRSRFSWDSIQSVTTVRNISLSGSVSWTVRRGVAPGICVYAGRSSFGPDPSGSTVTLGIGPTLTLYPFARGHEHGEDGTNGALIPYVSARVSVGMGRDRLTYTATSPSPTSRARSTHYLAGVSAGVLITLVQHVAVTGSIVYDHTWDRYRRDDDAAFPAYHERQSTGRVAAAAGLAIFIRP